MDTVSIYEDSILKISKLLTKDRHLQKDLAQEMRMSTFTEGRYHDKKIDSCVLWMAKNRAIDYLRKFLKGQIPFGDMNDIDNLINNNT